MKGTRRPNIPIRQNNTMIETPTIQGIGDPPLKDVFPTNEVNFYDDTSSDEEIEEEKNDETNLEIDPETGHYIYYGTIWDFKHRPQYGEIYALSNTKNPLKFEIIPGEEIDPDKKYKYVRFNMNKFKQDILPNYVNK